MARCETCGEELEDPGQRFCGGDRCARVFMKGRVRLAGASAMTKRAVLVALLSGWTLWHDIGIYVTAGHTRLGGPSYAVTAYETETACHAAQHEAIVRDELPRRGPLTERLSDGIKVWDPSREHYTTFRYRCAPAGAHLEPGQRSR